MNKRTVKRFFDSDAAVCPHCGSADYTGGHIDVDGTRIYQPVTCSDCDADFTIAATVDTVIDHKGDHSYRCDDINGNCTVTRE